MKVQLKNEKTVTASQASVYFATQSTDKKKKPHASVECTSKKVQSLVSMAVDELAFSAQKNETLFIRNAQVETGNHLLVIGLGELSTVTDEVLRSAAGQAYKTLTQNKVTEACFLLDSALIKTKNPGYSSQALCEGFLLSNYQFDDYKTDLKKTKKSELKSITFLSGKKGAPAALKKGTNEATILSECTNYAKWLGDSPGNLMTPEILADSVKKSFKGTKAKVTIWDKARIKKERFGGLYGVSLGSAVDPRFIIIEYNGAAPSKKPLAFVGKGLTFDCGGISIKPSASMEEMKYDMCGGANVIGTLLAITKLKLKVNVVGYIPASENMPGPLANKPGDILKFRNGMTCHVDNTDAEGRLILADALSYASEKKPAAIVDAATLTGAVLIALGNTHTGLMGRDQKMVEAVQKASKITGEKVWSLPLDETHVADMKGTFADLNNIGVGRFSGSSRAAAFLSHFVDEKIPWVHCDIAGTAWDAATRLTYTQPKLATGVMVRTFVEVAKTF